MDTNEIRIIDAGDEHQEALLAFYKRAYRRDDYPLANERFFCWWLRDNPYIGDRRISAKIALDGAAIVGHYCYTPIRLWTRGALCRAFWAGNLVVGEAYRRQGIGRRLIAALRQEGDVGLDVGASVVAEPMLVKEEWTHLGALHRWIGVLDAARAAPLAADPGAVEECALPPIPSGASHSSYTIRPIERFGAEHNLFWQRRRESIAYATDRDAARLNWRYADHPVFRYQAFEIRRGEEVEGYAIARKEYARGVTDPPAVMRIVEFLAFPGREEPLLQRLIQEARDWGAVLIDFFCASAAHGAAFEAHGFKRDAPWSERIARLMSPVALSKWTISFNAVAIDPAVFGGLGSKEQWYVTSGDGDQDRPNVM